MELSGETAKRDYPLEAVCMQHLIACEAEAAIYHLQLFVELLHLAPITKDPTEAATIDLLRPICTVASSLCYVRMRWAEDVDIGAMNVGKARGFIKKGDVFIVLTGWRPGSGFTNTMCVVP
ncbi:Pyruvate kinase isozymes M1/M2 [Cricetulus griseus]|uniref:Pyruvate kinase isozymes M1/M2 n=1 Tax=Cricetulus griseus TaxID=10029 RepID=G3HBB3_CRIGR|nr:Pyruvate kinase isozymes M1/M2 [Cricetulus griseus]